MSAAFGQLIGGHEVPAAGGGELVSVNPATAEPWATIPRGTAADVEAAVAAAKAALPGWRRLSALERAARLRRVGDLVAGRAAELAEIETCDNGKIITDTSVEIPACAQMWYFHAGAADKLHGDTIEISPQSFNFTRREPIGVIGVIIPWNSPLSLFSAKVAAPLAAGNTVVVKPAEQAACSCLALAPLFEEAGFPPGVVNIVSGLGEEAGDALVRHPDVGRVTFTGSTETARTISAAAAGTLKQLAFELGGKSPNIVFADADLDAAAIGVSTMGLFTGGAGQTCVAGSRVLVERPVYDDLLARVEKIAAGIVLGDPMDRATTMGPVVSDEQFARVRSYLELGVAEGAALAFGGRSGVELFASGSRFANGYYVEPTLFREADNSMRIAREEIFGPVGVVIPFDDDDEAVAIANDSTYGLACGVWTTNLKRAHRMVRDVEAGAVWVNAYRRIHWAVPFGGFKESGYGRDSGMESVLESTQIKGAWIDLS
jgi:acyl-CoA reductase-like NAD-dependent aldehyde dehydrogenase